MQTTTTNMVVDSHLYFSFLLNQAGIFDLLKTSFFFMNPNLLSKFCVINLFSFFFSWQVNQNHRTHKETILKLT